MIRATCAVSLHVTEDPPREVGPEVGRQTRRGLSQYEMAAQEQIRERNAEQAGQIPEPDLPSTGTSRISALLADAQRQREEAWRAQAERQREETLRAEAQRQAEEALVADGSAPRGGGLAV